MTTTGCPTEPGSLVALAGAGCTPAVWRAITHPDLTVAPRDWSADPPPWDLASIAGRLAARLAGARAADPARPILLAGHSVGGVIAMLTVLAAPPGTVDGLLVADTGASATAHRDGGLPDRVRAGWTAADRAAFLASCFHRPPDPDFRIEAATWLDALDPRVFLAAIESLRALDLRAHLGDLAVPTVVVHGRHDARRPAAHGEALAAGIPGARLVILETGHTPMVEDPVGFNGALAILWERIRGR